MNLIVLAAGVGSRLFPLTKNTPKSIIDLGDGTTMLERQIEATITCENINKMMLVTGYKAEQIDAKIKDYKSQLDLETVFNPFYDVSNNLISLWCAHFAMRNEDFIISNGDNIYNKGVFNRILDQSKEYENTIQLTIDTKDSYDDDDMKVLLAKDGKVKRVSKKIAISDCHAESVGLVLVKGPTARRIFLRKLMAMVREKENINRFWLEIFNSLIEDGHTIDTATIDQNDWRELDFHPDLALIKSELLKKITQSMDKD